jgi:hypothetical protein
MNMGVVPKEQKNRQVKKVEEVKEGEEILIRLIRLRGYKYFCQQFSL